MLRLRMKNLLLNLNQVSENKITEALQRFHSTGFTMTTLTRECSRDQNSVRRIHQVHNDCRRLQPPVHVRADPIPFERWYAAFADQSAPTALPDGYFIAAAGVEHIGVAGLEKRPGQPSILVCGFLGVQSKYCGRGVGLALKAATIRFARELGCNELETEVLEINQAMLQINKHFGFREVGSRDQEYPDRPCHPQEQGWPEPRIQ